MVTKNQRMQSLIRHYKRDTGKTDVSMHEVAEYALQNGWKAPKPKSQVDLLAQEFSAAAREEVRRDDVTGRPYRANHAYKIPSGKDQLTLWIDIDDAPRFKMRKSAINRREQMVGDAVQLTLDLEHWNRINPTEEPIIVPLDFTEDIQERLAIMDSDDNVHEAA